MYGVKILWQSMKEYDFSQSKKYDTKVLGVKVGFPEKNADIFWLSTSLVLEHLI